MENDKRAKLMDIPKLGRTAAIQALEAEIDFMAQMLNGKTPEQISKILASPQVNVSYCASVELLDRIQAFEDEALTRLRSPDYSTAEEIANFKDIVAQKSDTIRVQEKIDKLYGRTIDLLGVRDFSASKILRDLSGYVRDRIDYLTRTSPGLGFN